MAVLSADHHIPDDARLRGGDPARGPGGARRAGRWSRSACGRRAPRPATATSSGARRGRAHPGLRRVRRFVEKPDAARARRYLRQGGYLWNAGIFVWRARAYPGGDRVCAPELHRALAPLRKQPRGGTAARRRAAYRRAPSLPIDVAVMERSRRVWTLPVDFAWSDVGTWSSLAEELGRRRPAREPGDRGRGPLRRAPRTSSGAAAGRWPCSASRGSRSSTRGTPCSWHSLDRSPDVRRFVAALKAEHGAARTSRRRRVPEKQGHVRHAAKQGGARIAARDPALLEGERRRTSRRSPSHLIERRFPKHTTIVEEGLPGDYMYVIREGRVKVTKLSEDGREKILEFLEAGRLLRRDGAARQRAALGEREDPRAERASWRCRAATSSTCCARARTSRWR